MKLIVMKHRSVVLFLICLLLVWICLYIRMQINVKEPIVEAYNMGEKFKYYGLEIIPMSYEIYDYYGFREKYGQPDKNMTDELNDRYIVANLHVKNTSGYDLKLKNGLETWMMGIDNYSNGQSADLEIFNKNNPYKKDAEIDMKLFFRFVDGGNYNGNTDSIKNSRIRVYMSFYPEERYVEFQ